MNAAEALTIVQFVQEACPAQKFSEYTPDIWTELLADLDVRDARTAVVKLGKRLSFIGPPDIRAEVARIRAERLRTASTAALEPHDVDPNDVPAYLAAVRARREVVAAGNPLEPEPVPAATRPVAELVASVAARLPRMPAAAPQVDLRKKRRVAS